MQASKIFKYISRYIAKWSHPFLQQDR